jgi:hypothetical protein
MDYYKDLNYYEILNLKTKATAEEIGHEYRKELRRIDEDQDYMNVEERIAYLNLIKDTLLDKKKRANYNSSLTKDDIYRIEVNYNLYRSAKKKFELLKECVPEVEKVVDDGYTIPNKSKPNDIKLDVLVTYKEKGVSKYATGRLEEVVPFKDIRVGNLVMPFIGNGIAINEIVRIDKLKVIYDTTSPVYGATNDKEIAELIRNNWGHSEEVRYLSKRDAIDTHLGIKKLVKSK